MTRSDWRAARIDRFVRHHGFVPDLATPRRFSEKVLNRILHDDDPHYRLYATKLCAPYFLRHRRIAGLNFARRYKVLTRLHVTDFDDLPQAFVMKSSFGSGLNEVVRDKTGLDRRRVVEKFNTELPIKRNARNHSDPLNCVVIEELLPGQEDGLPDDYKVHCFHSADGTFRSFLALGSGVGDSLRHTTFGPDGAQIDLRFGPVFPHESAPRRLTPDRDLRRMARDISRGFDYVRVDLFDTPKGVFFGEITPFHQNASLPVLPERWDIVLGAHWDQRFPSFDPAGIGRGDLTIL